VKPNARPLAATPRLHALSSLWYGKCPSAFPEYQAQDGAASLNHFIDSSFHLGFHGCSIGSANVIVY
jgi:hypothetical protein